MVVERVVEILRPVWAWAADGTPKSLLFVATVPAAPAVLDIAASALYRLFVNGELVGYGPARAPLGFARVDQVDISRFLTHMENVVSIEVVAYTVENFYVPRQTPFLAAVLRSPNEDVLAAIGETGDFRAYRLPQRDWNVEKISCQRDLMESYDFKAHPEALECFSSAHPPLPEVKMLECAETPKFIPRVAPPVDISVIYSGRLVHSASLRHLPGASSGNSLRRRLENDYALDDAAGDAFQLFDLDRVRTGFIMAEIAASEDSELILSWDELLVDGHFDIRRFYWANNFIRFRLAAGQRLHFESFEAYTMRYLAAFVLSGAVEIRKGGLREYAFDSGRIIRPELSKGSEIEKGIYLAAVETFRQNAVDILMDCPGRERAGWLCDSFFTARAEQFLTGRADVEDAFIENFLLPGHYPSLPDGMFPMCFPADNPNCSFIPQWPMWLFLEIGEKQRMKRGRDFSGAIKDRMFNFFAFCEKFRNPEGLLEDLPGWNFVEWSGAKDFIAGTHFPTNMLFAACLRLAGELYHDDALSHRSEKIRETILALSFDGSWFNDNAIRSCGRLEITGNKSEICQYLADFCGITDPKMRHWNEWRDKLLNKSRHGELAAVNMFVGRMLRFELLLSAGRFGQFRKEAVETLSHMVERTGTLWEMDEAKASCCHGFASVLAPYLQTSYSDSRVGSEDILE